MPVSVTHPRTSRTAWLLASAGGLALVVGTYLCLVALANPCWHDGTYRLQSPTGTEGRVTLSVPWDWWPFVWSEGRPHIAVMAEATYSLSPLVSQGLLTVIPHQGTLFVYSRSLNDHDAWLASSGYVNLELVDRQPSRFCLGDIHITSWELVRE